MRGTRPLSTVAAHEPVRGWRLSLLRSTLIIASAPRRSATRSLGKRAVSAVSGHHSLPVGCAPRPGIVLSSTPWWRRHDLFPGQSPA